MKVLKLTLNNTKNHSIAVRVCARARVADTRRAAPTFDKRRVRVTLPLLLVDTHAKPSVQLFLRAKSGLLETFVCVSLSLSLSLSLSS